MTAPLRFNALLALGWAACFPAVRPLGAAEVRLLLPLNRTACQTNEWIDVAVVRSAGEALPASPLVLTLAGADGGTVAATFAAPAVPVRGREARGVEHLHLNGWLLRPGRYTLEAAVDGASAKAEIEVCSHIRGSGFRLVNWGRAAGKDLRLQGEDSFGFNLFYGGSSDEDAAHLIRAGVDMMGVCVMSGGHQMDLRSECDWSDPHVTRGGTRRVVRRAMTDRTRPNVPGVHFYDEPGLTWEKSDATGEVTPHAVRAQARSYRAAFGRDPLPYDQVDPKNPEHVARWRHWALWKLGFMDAAWRESQLGVSRVRPDYLSLTQSQYGFPAFTDGYYFNVARSLPVTSGHGGYHDFGPCFFNPSYHLEMARARDLGKPCWYLPTWYSSTTADQFRLEQYLSFQTGLQGMISPPDCEPAKNAGPRQGIVESNQLMRRLGPVLAEMPVTRPPVALLYALSSCIRKQTEDRRANYAHDTRHGRSLPLAYLAGKLLQCPFMTVLEEDVLDGTLAAHHRAVLLTSIDTLDPAVIAELEAFAAGGGRVLLTGDCTVKVRGAVTLPVSPRLPDQEAVDKRMEAKQYDQLGPYTTMGKYYEGAAPLAKAIGAELERANIAPVLVSDLPTIAATRQAEGDVEYLFAVNATWDENDAKDPKNAVKAAVATLRLPDDGRPVYDAVRGGEIPELRKEGGAWVGAFRFGPGQMRVFARTARAIGGVRLSRPAVVQDLTQDKAPVQVRIGAVLLDGRGGVIGGSVPLHVRVVDPLGVTRHELHRATRLGAFAASLPLAANDPAGEWTVVVRESLAGTEDAATFRYAPPLRARGIAGATPRAVSIPDDRGNAFRFARCFHDVTIVTGGSAFNEAAAQRLAGILAPWGVRCRRMDLAEAAKPRRISDEEARTWCGLNYAGRGQIKPGDGNPPALAGFAVQGPVILLGNPEDHPIIKLLLAERFLPYAPDPLAFPGPGRGLLAWQRDGVGAGQESITLIAYDEAGMGEAVGSLYEAVAGIEPLTTWTWPESVAIAPATSASGLAPAATVAWTVLLPDRVLALKPAGGGLEALTHDGSLSTLTAQGKVAASRPLAAGDLAKALQEMAPAADPVAAEAASKQARPDRLLKLSASAGGLTAVAYWGGTLRVVDVGGAIQAGQQLPQDITALAWLDGRLVAGLADGRVMALEVK